VIKDVRLGKPARLPDVLGVLDGHFNFEVVRGQGAQTFP
jgi:hypothetical protein